MSEFASLDRDRYELVSRLVNGMYAGVVQQVIADIKALPDSCRQSGDDSSLKDVWEEYKYQIQREQFIMFELYVEVIRDICTWRVQGIERERLQLLWLWTEGYLDLWVDQDEMSLADMNPEAVVTELYERVSAVASNEKLEVDPDEERDRERYEEDMKLYLPEIETDKDE